MYKTFSKLSDKKMSTKKRLKEENKILGIENSFQVDIYVGRYDTENDIEYSKDALHEICQFYVSETGLCVSIFENTYIYGNNGNWESEGGSMIRLIHYPRFPRENPLKSLMDQALKLAEKLMKELNQKRVSVVNNEKTITLKNPNHEEIE